MDSAAEMHDFEAVKARLEEIANAVGDENMPLDEALDLFEEAVSLGLKVGDLVEEGISVEAGDVGEAAGNPEEAPGGTAGSEGPSPE